MVMVACSARRPKRPPNRWPEVRPQQQPLRGNVSSSPTPRHCQTRDVHDRAVRRFYAFGSWTAKELSQERRTATPVTMRRRLTLALEPTMPITRRAFVIVAGTTGLFGEAAAAQDQPGAQAPAGPFGPGRHRLHLDPDRDGLVTPLRPAT